MPPYCAPSGHPVLRSKDAQESLPPSCAPDSAPELGGISESLPPCCAPRALVQNSLGRRQLQRRLPRRRRKAATGRGVRRPDALPADVDLPGGDDFPGDVAPRAHVDAMAGAGATRRVGDAPEARVAGGVGDPPSNRRPVGHGFVGPRFALLAAYELSGDVDTPPPPVAEGHVGARPEHQDSGGVGGPPPPCGSCRSRTSITAAR